MPKNTLHFACKILLAGVGILSGFGALGADKNQARLASVTNLPDFDCSSANSKSGAQKCDSIVFQVQLVKIKQVDGTEVACVAYFPYSKLTVHTGVDGDPVTLRWHVSPLGSFVGNGVDIKENYGDKKDDLVDTQSATPQDASMTFKSKIKKKKMFDHRPITQLDFGGGVVKSCDGADPIISNSAD